MERDKDVSDESGARVAEISEPLVLETVWLKQNTFEDAECFFQTRVNGYPSEDDNESQETTNNFKTVVPLQQEMIWLQQRNYEDAEKFFQERLSGHLKDGKHTNNSQVKVKKKEAGPPPMEYGQKLDDIMSVLLQKHSTLQNTIDRLQEGRRQKEIGIRQSMAKLSSAIQTCNKRMDSEISAFKEHIVSSQQLLDSLHTTVQCVKEKREVGKPKVSWKPFYNSLKNIEKELVQWNEETFPLCLGKKDITSEIRQSVKQLKFVKSIGSTSKCAKKYSSLMLNLKNVKKKTALPVNDVVKNDSCEFIKGCFSLDKSWATISDDFANWFGSQQDGGDAASVETKPHPSKDGKISKGKNTTRNSDLQPGERKEADRLSQVKKTVIHSPQSKAIKSLDSSNSPKRMNKKRGKKGSPSFEYDDESLDGSLGSECFSDSSLSTQGDLIACFLSQPGGDDVVIKTKSGSKSKKISKRKSTQDSKTVIAQGNKSKSNTVGKKKSSPPQSKAKSSDPSGASSNPKKTNGKQGKSSPHQNKNFQLDVMNSFRADKNFTHLVNGTKRVSPKEAQFEPIRQQERQFTMQQKKEYSSCEYQLCDMADSIKQMLFIYGPTIQLQEMLAEAELLLQMIHNGYMEDHFRHRFSLLQMAYNYHQQAHFKMDRANVSINSQSINQNFPSTGKSGGKSTKAGGKKKPENDCTENEMSLMLAKKTNMADQLVMERRVIPCGSSSVRKIAVFNPFGSMDNHRAGISSIVILDDLKRMVMVDIINGCLKLFALGKIHEKGSGTLVSYLDLHQPYYMTTFCSNKVLVTRAEKMLSVVEVSHKRGLELKELITCRVQYYGLGWVKDDIVACANYEGSTIDLLRVYSHKVKLITSIRTTCHGPELLAVTLNLDNNIVFLERVPGQSMHLTCISSNGSRLFHVSLGGGEMDVWNLACIEDKIVCCNKQTNRILLLSSDKGQTIKSLPMPLGTVKMPFAISFSKYGEMFLANDAAWEEDNNHYVTTEINVFAFEN